MKNNREEKIHEKILEILKEIIRICDENNIMYYAACGTCLGAVRHKGFIPWDDDIDLVMPIDDYKKFRKIAKTELEDPFELIDSMDKTRSKNMYCKVHNKNTTLIEKFDFDYPERYKGVFVDVFPISGCPVGKIKKKIYLGKLSFLSKMNFIKNLHMKERISFKSKVFWILMKPFCLFKENNYYVKKWEKELSKYKFCKDNDVVFPWRMPLKPPHSNVFKYEWFNGCTTVDFENIKINIPKDYVNYLKADFGEYMKLPEPEKRTSGHNIAFFDDNTPCDYYKKHQDEIIEKGV